MIKISFFPREKLAEITTIDLKYKIVWFLLKKLVLSKIALFVKKIILTRTSRFFRNEKEK